MQETLYLELAENLLTVTIRMGRGLNYCGPVFCIADICCFLTHFVMQLMAAMFMLHHL
jgi:hypothetical protein